MDDNPSITDFDSLTFSNDLQKLKAALPYMENSEQKSLTILIKTFELRNALSLIQSQDNQLSACSTHSDNGTMLDMLQDIRQFCTTKEQDFIDLFVNFNQASQLFSSYQTSPDSENSHSGSSMSMFDLMQNFLSKDQQAAFTNYSQLFSNM